MSARILPYDRARSEVVPDSVQLLDDVLKRYVEAAKTPEEVNSRRRERLAVKNALAAAPGPLVGEAAKCLRVAFRLIRTRSWIYAQLETRRRVPLNSGLAVVSYACILLARLDRATVVARCRARARQASAQWEDVMTLRPIPASPQQLPLPLEPRCPRCTTNAPVEFDAATDLWVCAGCAASWRVPADAEPRR